MKTDPPLVLIALTGSPSGYDGLLLQILLAEARQMQGLSDLATIYTSSEAAAVDLLRRGAPDIVLLEAPFETRGGLQTLEALLRAAPDVPVVAIADSQDPGLARQVLRLGARDCLLRAELSSAVLGRALRYALEHQRSETALRRLERYDSLTGLLTGRSLLEILGRLLERHQRQPDSAFGVLVVEVGDLPVVVHRYGRALGDELLIGVARRLEEAARAGDLVARLGDSDFVLVLASVCSRAEIESVAGRLRDSLSRPLALRQRVMDLSVRSGSALSEEPFDGPHDMVGAAVLQLKCS